MAFYLILLNFGGATNIHFDINVELSDLAKAATDSHYALKNKSDSLSLLGLGVPPGFAKCVGTVESKKPSVGNHGYSVNSELNTALKIGLEKTLERPGT